MPENLLTLRDVAGRLGVRLHVAKHAIAEYGIVPRQRAGIIRLWSVDDLPTIAAAVRRVAGRLGGSHAN